MDGWWRWLSALMALAMTATACTGGDSSTGDSASGGAADDGTAAAGSEVDSGSSATATCAPGETDGDLALFNWPDYIAPQQLDFFGDEFGVEVVSAEFDSNDELVAAMTAGGSGYSVIVPGGYAVPTLIDDELVQPLAKEALPNLSNLAPDFVGLDYDPATAYAVPYQWGTTGLAVDTRVVGTDFPRSWALVFDPEVADAHGGPVSLLDEPRETLGAALRYLGYSLNTTDQGQLDEAAELVASVQDRVGFDSDSPEEPLTTGATAVAHVYSGETFLELSNIDDASPFVYFVPEEGGSRWIDHLMIPADAPSPCTAHTFINWLLEPQPGALVSNYNYYATPNAAAVAELDGELVELLDRFETAPAASLEEIADVGQFEANYVDAFDRVSG